MSRGAMAFLAGMGTGYLNGEKEKEKQKRQDKLDKQQDELHTSKMDEIKRTQQDRTDLQVAGAPATVREMEGPQPEAAYAGLPPGQEPKPLGYIAGNGTSARGFAEKGVADASAVEQNAPGAWQARAANLARQGNAFAAASLDVDHKLTQRGRDETTWKQAQTAHAKKLKEEGVFDTADALRRGDAAAATEAFNRDGKHKIVEGSMVLVPEDRDIPGFGKIKTHTATFQVRMPDGTVEQRTYNSHDLSAALMPYEKQLDTQLKGVDRVLAERKTEVAERQAAITERKMDYLISGGAARGRPGGGRAAGAGGNGEPSQSPTFNPLGSFDSKKAQDVAFEQAAAKTDDKGQPLTPEAQGQMAQQIYRSMEDAFAAENTTRERARVFKSEATKAKTPEEIQALRQRALQSGYTQQEMAVLDKRFEAPKVAVKEPPSNAAAAARKGVVPALNASNTKVLSEAAPIKSWGGIGAAEPAYNIELPDGTTKIVPVSELKQMGFPVNSLRGKTFYDPNYK